MERDHDDEANNTKQSQIDRLEAQMVELKQEMADVKSLLDRRLTDLFQLLSSSSSSAHLPTSSLSTSSASIDTGTPGRHFSPSSKALSFTEGSDDDMRMGTKPRRSFKRERDIEGISSPKRLPQLRKSLEGLNGVSSLKMNEIEDEEELMEEDEDDTMRQRSGKRRRVEFEDGHVGREDVLEAEVESDCYLLQRLPVEVWTHILSFVLAKKSPFASLSATLLACKLWRRVPTRFDRIYFDFFCS